VAAVPTPGYETDTTTTTTSTQVASVETTKSPGQFPPLGMNFRQESFTDCEEVRGGEPPVCLDVCTTITSIFQGDTLIHEMSKTEQKKCENWKEFMKEQKRLAQNGDQSD